MIIYLTFLPRIKNILDVHCWENQTQILCPIILFRNFCHLLDNVEKYCTAGQASDENEAHVHSMLDT